MDTLLRLQRWYAAQCDGDWEHGWGVRIGTLDNPGWRVEIDLGGTALEAAPFVEVSDTAPDVEWLRCWVEGKRFHGAGGVPKLKAILSIFLDWAEAVGSNQDAEPGAAADGDS